MILKKHLAILFAAILLAAIAPASVEAVQAVRGPIVKQGKTLDEQGIWLENDQLKLAITTNAYAGQVMELIYKPTGQSLAPEAHTQGYCTDRMGEDRFFWTERRSQDYAGKILSQSADLAEAEMSYLWNYDYNDVQTQIAVSKTYRLRRGASSFEVVWKLKNVGETTAQMTPWIKQLGGHQASLLQGPTLIPREAGPSDPGPDFVNPAADWAVRLSGSADTEAAPMVYGVMDFRRILQQFPWRGKERFTLETILHRITLEPGQSWEHTYVLGAAPSLANVSYIAPELAAAASLQGDEALLQIAAALDLGELRLEGEVTDSAGKVATLPNRQVKLTAGKISTVAYPFKPTGDGVYTFSLTLYDGQEIYRLGQAVNSQRSSITVPVVVGPAPAVVMTPWQSEAGGWPGRQAEQRTPWRTLLKSSRLSAGQFLIPDRIFPEDVIDYGDVQPAAFSAARDEQENLQFAVEVSDPADVMGLELVVQPFQNEQREKLPALTLREAVYLTTDTPSGYKNFPIGAWPDPLFEQGWLDQLQGDSAFRQQNLETFRQSRRRVYWLHVHVPREATPGLYRGRVDLLLHGQPAGQLLVELNVRQFALPARPSFRCCSGMVGFGAGKFETSLQSIGVPQQRIDQLTGQGDPQAESLLDQHWRRSLEYGWTPTMYSGVKMWEKHQDDGRGISVFAGHGKADETAWLQERGRLADSFTYAPFDEHADELVPRVADWCREFQKQTPMPILDCYYGGNVKPLYGLVKVWLGQSAAQPWARERKAAGDRFYHCNSSLVWHVEYAPLTGRAVFWQDFADGADGRYVYSTARWTPEVFTKNWTSGNYMGCVIYPGPHGLATSIRWETLRDSIEDYDYLALLRQADPGTLPAEAKALLGDADLGSRVQTAAQLHALRNQIAAWLEAK
ncbi:glycoside hydrolase domain-containing protein [Lignipirellula cremea]|uniref:Uncharacterized protein n=1 Tax=Lignipirellula cremea TaxID=2528010 RepID=A0A518E2X1_9BACT|nr:glycoside hydrolase domain-containing protein [Lignipirellula cremea]QDU98434.1 hypothetical protein Pla8534_63020 [Lignipirellula cremea]